MVQDLLSELVELYTDFWDRMEGEFMKMFLGR
jgi:hypothetical protein